MNAMSVIFSQIFLYLGCVYCINSVLIYLARRLKISDFIAHILTGVLFAAAVAGWAALFGPQNAQPYQTGYRITEHTIDNLRAEKVPQAVLTDLDSIKNRVYVGEGVFLDTLASRLGEAEALRHKTQIFRFAAVSDRTFNTFIIFLTQLGLLLFLVQIGFNFDPKFFQAGSDNALKQAFLVMALIVLILGGTGYFLLFEQNAWITVFWVIAFLSIHIGAVLSAKFPITLSLKKPLKELVQLAVILDIVTLALFTLVSIYLQFRGYNPSGLKGDLPRWVALTFFILPALLPRKTEQFFGVFQKLLGEYTILLKLGFFFLFLYFGFHSGLSVLILGIWAGLLFKSFAGAVHFEVQQKFFSNVSFLYIFPFVEIGRSLVAPREYSLDFWYAFGIILAALASISLLLIALISLRKREYPLALSLGAFPRGELSVLILWLFKEAYLIPFSLFVVSVAAVMASSLLGSFSGKYLFSASLERLRRLSRR